MINTASALRRGLLVMSLAAVMLAVVIGVTLATNVQGQERLSLAAPTAGDVWSPADGTPITFYASSNLQVVVTLTKEGPATFDKNTAKYNIIESDGLFTQHSATANVGVNANTIVITADNFNVSPTEKKIQFLISDSLGKYHSSTYPLLALSHHLYVPIIHYTPDGSNPCSAFPTSPSTPYSIAQDQQYRFFSITLPVTSTVNVTATNYKVTNGQMQVRLRPTSSCVTTGTEYVLNYVTLLITKTNNTFATYNMAPGNYLVRFSADTLSSTPFTFTWSSVAGWGPYELNNTLCTAAAITPGNTLYAYPDDSDDYYYFDSSLSNTTIQATISGFNIPGQYQLIKGNPDCSTYIWPPVSSATASIGTTTMVTTSQTSGRYFLRVLALNQTGYNQSQAYSFKISISTGLLASSTSSASGQVAELPTPIAISPEGEVRRAASTDQAPAP